VAVRRIKADLNFEGNQSQYMVVHSGTTFPTALAEGQLFYRSDEDKIYICTDPSTPVWVACGSGSSSGGGTFDWTFNWNGILRVANRVDGPRIATGNGTIERVTIWRGRAGSSGNTTIDVNKNGSSLFNSATNPIVTAASGNNAVNSVTAFDSGEADFSLGDVITVDIDTVEVGLKIGLVVMIRVKYDD